MPTILHAVCSSHEEYDSLQAYYKNLFLHGECYAFSLALHAGLGWPIVGLMKDNQLWHTGVRAPNGRILDARGGMTEQKFGSYYLPPPHIIREVAPEELYATRPIPEHIIIRARQVAEVIFPSLHWIDSAAMKIRAFADELEALSRKYGLWICGSVPADPPHLFAEGGGRGRIRDPADHARVLSYYYPLSAL